MAGRSRKSHPRERGIGKLEANVDAVLLGAGLELNKPLDKLVEQSKRGRAFRQNKGKIGKLRSARRKAKK